MLGNVLEAVSWSFITATRQMADVARSLSVDPESPPEGHKDVREKERRGRPRIDQRWTKDGRKDMRGRPPKGATLYKVGTE